MKRIETEVFVVIDQDGLMVGFNEHGDQIRIHEDDFANNIDDVTYSDRFCRTDDPSIKAQGWTAYRVILEEIKEEEDGND